MLQNQRPNIKRGDMNDWLLGHIPLPLLLPILFSLLDLHDVSFLENKESLIKKTFLKKAKQKNYTAHCDVLGD